MTGTSILPGREKFSSIIFWIFPVAAGNRRTAILPGGGTESIWHSGAELQGKIRDTGQLSGRYPAVLYEDDDHRFSVSGTYDLGGAEYAGQAGGDARTSLVVQKSFSKSTRFFLFRKCHDCIFNDPCGGDSHLCGSSDPWQMEGQKSVRKQYQL